MLIFLMKTTIHKVFLCCCCYHCLCRSMRYLILSSPKNHILYRKEYVCTCARAVLMYDPCLGWTKVQSMQNVGCKLQTNLSNMPWLKTGCWRNSNKGIRPKLQATTRFSPGKCPKLKPSGTSKLESSLFSLINYDKKRKWLVMTL